MVSRRRRCLVVSLLLILLGLPAGALAGEPGPRDSQVGEDGGEYAQDRVLVKLVPGARARSLHSDPNEIREIGRGWVAVPVPDGVDAADFVATLETRPEVEAASLNHIARIFASPPFVPNDPWWTGASNQANRQWHMHRIDLLDAWKQSVGSGVKVAVIDTGVTNGALDGFCHALVDEADIVFGDYGPGTGRDWHGHGSHVAGTVAQCGGNGKFGTGVAPEARIMPINVFLGEDAQAIDVLFGIFWAIDHGAGVINMSLGFPTTSIAPIDDAIDEAVAAGIVVVAAAGNEPGPLYYPANHPNVIAVGAVDFFNRVTDYSARGSGLDLVAPGGSAEGLIWQESPPESGAGYTGYAGTSMAAPHVAGVAALLKSGYPSASALQIREAMRCTAQDLGNPGWDNLYGWGLVQAGRAMSALGQMVSKGWSSCAVLPANATKIATIHSSSGNWFLWNGTSLLKSFTYGRPGDVPFMGDWDGDGVDTPGLYRQSDGFVYLRNSNSDGWADVEFFFGRSGDIPVVGDFDGDGVDTVSVYRPSTGKFYIKNELKDGWADYEFVFGRPGDVPFAGDWDGDGVDSVGLRRPSNGFVYLRNKNSAGWADHEFFYGKAGDVVFAGDWNGDGKDSIGLYRPSNGYIYLRNKLSSGNAQVQYFIGTGIKPAAGDY